MMDLLLFPFGGNAREALVAVLAQNETAPSWNVVGFIDDHKDKWDKQCCGIKVLGGRKVIDDFPSAQVLAVPGNPKNFRERKKIIGLLQLPLERFATVIDPLARIAPDARIGKNSVLMANAVISSSVKIGDHCVILPNTVIAHDSVIGDYTLIGSNVTISGGCKIGLNCYIGSCTSIKENLNIGHGSFLGLASNVIREVSKNEMVAGNPARFLREL